MAWIHPSSIVDQRAQLAEDVHIGPQCVIEGLVRLGSGARLIGSVYLRGPLTLGRNNIIYPHACLGLEPQDRKFDARTDGAGVSIGDDNVFREGVTVHRATGAHPTTIGQGNYFMVNTHVGHDAVVHDRCMMANGALLGGHVTLQDAVVMGGNSGVHQFCRVGRLGMLSGRAGITQDLPPFCVVYQNCYVRSLNLVGLRRAGLRCHIPLLQQAFNILFKQRLATPHALERIEQELGHDPLCAELAAFCRASKRGLCSYQAWNDEKEV